MFQRVCLAEKFKRSTDVFRVGAAEVLRIAFIGLVLLVYGKSGFQTVPPLPQYFTKRLPFSLVHAGTVLSYFRREMEINRELLEGKGPLSRAACKFEDSASLHFARVGPTQKLHPTSNHGICDVLMRFSHPARRVQRNASVHF